MKGKYIWIFLILLKSWNVWGQSDSIVVYDPQTRTVKVIPPVAYHTTVTFDKTSGSIGAMGNQTALSLLCPTSHLMDGTAFTEIARAELFFNITDFPIRTATRLFRYVNDSLCGACSGILVGKNMVLTAAHCIRDKDNKKWRGDSTLIATGYDNGKFHALLPQSMVSKYYIFNSYYTAKSGIRDFALLQLKDPIGEQTGWIGMAFNTDPQYFSNKVFHKLSYPADASLVDTAIHVNGDTLYYNYGNIDVLYAGSLGLNSPKARLIPGQSGSSLFYTDNTDYYSMGVAIFSSNYTHYGITNQVFYQFKNLIENYATVNSIESYEKSICRVYPNPLREYAHIEFDNPHFLTHSLVVFNSYGQLVRTYDDIQSNRVRFDKGILPGGLYIYKLCRNGQVVAMGKFIIQ